MFLHELKNKSILELIELSKELDIESSSLSKSDLIVEILNKNYEKGVTIYNQGVLEIMQDRFGFIRSAANNYLAQPDDVYVGINKIKKFNLINGDIVSGIIKPPNTNNRYFYLDSVDEINYKSKNDYKYRINFDSLTPLFPDQRINLECEHDGITTRITDIISPIGKGQRALIVAPPKTGKTIMLKNIAYAISKNNPEIFLMVLLIDERPEEVTDMIRSVNGEVITSTFDESAERHIKVTEMVIDKAKRLVESGKDVVILLDSITRLARAYNACIPSSGKVLSGGVDSNALQKPKRIFGAARNIEEGGSLTIIATALVDTGSKMDEVIFEEFKGTGNSEIILDRKLSEKRIFPAINLIKSNTRREDLLINKEDLSKIWILRKILGTMNCQEGIEFLIEEMKKTKSNEDFFKNMNT